MYRKIDFDAIGRAGKVDAQISPITWDFSTEKAPWTNAITERLVQSVKKSLRPTVVRGVLTFEQLEVLFIEIEGIINCRPLAVQHTNNPEDLIPVTPSLLMYGKNLMPIEDPPRALRQTEIDPPAFAKRFQVRQQLLDTFWRKWKKEYLSRYEVNRTWRKKHENALNIGDVVVIIDPDKLNKRNDWKLGRVIEPTFFAETGDLSGAKCRLANGQVVTRHLRQLALLESDTSFRGKQIANRSTSHDDHEVTVTPIVPSPEDPVPGTSTSRPVTKKSPSHDASPRDTVAGRPSEQISAKKVKVKTANIADNTIMDLTPGKSPEDPTPTIRTVPVKPKNSGPKAPGPHGPATEMSTSDSVRCRDPCLARPLRYDPRRAGEGASPDQADAASGGDIYGFGKGENDSGGAAGDASGPTLPEHQYQLRKRAHRAPRKRANKKLRK